MIRLPKKEKQNFSLLNNSINIKLEANKEEKKLAKLMNGKRTINSGSKLFDPADIKLDDYIIDLKTAFKQKQIIVNEKMLKKILSESDRVGKKPLIMLNFPNSKLRIKKWIIVPYE